MPDQHMRFCESMDRNWERLVAPSASIWLQQNYAEIKFRIIRSTFATLQCHQGINPYWLDGVRNPPKMHLSSMLYVENRNH